jgi:rod shape determining protein RodA
MGLFGGNSSSDLTVSDEGRFDWRLLGTMVAIMFVGALNVYSATLIGPTSESASDYVIRQFIFFGIGLVVIGCIMIFDYRFIERLAYIFYGINLVALIAVEFAGSVRYGARRWLDFGAFSYQPSETMKLLTILALAKFFHNRTANQKMDFKDLVIPGLILGVPALLTIIQPDLGTGGHLAISGTTILVFMGIRARVLVTVAILGIVSFPVFWKYGLKPYQKERIKTFIDPTGDPKGQGYNALQSMIAVGSGKIVGKGFGKGTQTQLDFTPEGHTDFIFTVLAEEWGLLGCLLLFGLYLYLFYRCVMIASNAREKFGSLVCVGIIGMLASQVFINIAMVTGMFPIVGIPLPLTSYGGTSVLTVCVSLGLLLNIGYRKTIF